METNIVAKSPSDKKQTNGVVRLPNSGLEFKVRFSKSGTSPYSCVQWEKREAKITNEKGETVFEQDNIEVPSHWSQMATNVVSSKYFRGKIGSPQREHSVRTLISRVVETIAAWGLKDGYFRSKFQSEIFNNELTTILLEQRAAFNSPVWFNVGVEPEPQCSACFILSVEDNLSSLLELQRSEALLFKYGSGAGTNLSAIRSSREILSGGGIPSGPVSFMRGYDAWAGTIKSGGKTRRAAKMQILNCDHPDIKEFVNAKRIEEEKARALIAQGYNGGFNIRGGAYDSVFFQNSNFSVRVTDDFMNAVTRGDKFPLRARSSGEAIDSLDAQELLSDIAKNAWACGDPGLQFDSTINDWHTCPNSGRINASNPCSEYMHVDDSACNLASINLLTFLDEAGGFDVEGFLHTVDILITAQDIIVDNASYPTETIGTNSKNLRQLGLGFANLGALLMSLGLPYDSEEGRALAAALMALLCGESYLMSTRLAEELGAFAAYEKNNKAMCSVIEKHRQAAEALPKTLITETLVERAQMVWDETAKRGLKFGYRNSQTTVLAPTGTIAFLMDCDTTGVEPDIALVKYKKLVGGGLLKIVNGSVKRALQKLGYQHETIEKIAQYIDQHDTIEGAPEFSQEHLPVFDCAFKPINGKRCISPKGHVLMMAALQPFVSGAISKTVNLPENTSVEDIYNIYVDAWKRGVKAIAVYRDNSKGSQPLATTSSERKTESPDISTIRRRRLPDERQAITHKFNIGGHEGYITVGLYDDGSPGEIFVVMAKEGSTLSGIMDAFATSISLALQYGVPLSALVKKFSHMRFEPSGMTNNKQIPFAKSPMDYIFRWLAIRFLSPEEQQEVGILYTADSTKVVSGLAASAVDIDRKTPTAKTTNAIGFRISGDALETNSASQPVSLPPTLFLTSDDAPPCLFCGSSLMVRQGSCYRCLNCGSQGGCG